MSKHKKPEAQGCTQCGRVGSHEIGCHLARNGSERRTIETDADRVVRIAKALEMDPADVALLSPDLWDLAEKILVLEDIQQ